MNLTNIIDAFFAKNFKKKFISIISLPLLLTTFFLTDFFLLPEIVETDRISQIYSINIPKSAGGTRVRSSHKAGYKYVTNKNYKFSTLSHSMINSPKINITLSPILKTVKTVMIKDIRIDLASGFNGINAVMILFCNFVIIISISYVLFVNNITEHARLSLTYSNLFFFVIWGCVLILF